LDDYVNARVSGRSVELLDVEVSFPSGNLLGSDYCEYGRGETSRREQVGRMTYGHIDDDKLSCLEHRNERGQPNHLFRVVPINWIADSDQIQQSTVWDESRLERAMTAGNFMEIMGDRDSKAIGCRMLGAFQIDNHRFVPQLSQDDPEVCRETNSFSDSFGVCNDYDFGHDALFSLATSLSVSHNITI